MHLIFGGEKWHTLKEPDHVVAKCFSQVNMIRGNKQMNLKKDKLFLTIGLLFSLLFLPACGKKQISVPKPPKNMQPITNKIATQENYAAKQEQLEQFVNKKMVTKQGIYTAYSSGSEPDEQKLARRAFLSESAGFWLQYLVGQDKKKEFNDFYQRTKTTFYQQKQAQFAYQYDPKTKKKSVSNAGLDDLRIMRALLMYDSKYRSTKYQKEINILYNSYRQHLIKGKGEIASFYDTKAKRSARVSPLAYYDLKTLRFLEGQGKKGRETYARQLKLVQKGYLGEVFPLYAAQYDGDSGQYSTKNLNTSEALVVLLHLAEVGKLRPASLAWLKEQVDQQSLRNSYTISGQIVDNSSSTGNYALAALIFAAHGDDGYYVKALDIVWHHQITGQEPALLGAISSQPYQITYSYDNLLTLLAAQLSSKASK